MTIGIKNEISLTVTDQMTAAALGSGEVRVLATPYMIAAMEKVSYQSIEPYLEPGGGSVGTSINIRHLAATPVGDTITAKSEIIAAEGRRVTFSVEVYDSRGKIGEGTHERAIISVGKFLEKAYSKIITQ